MITFSSRVDQLIHQLCPKGVEFKTLGEVGTLIRGSGLQKSDFTKSGVGCIHYGQIYTHYGIFANSTKSFVSLEKAAKLKHAKYGDVLITGVSENVEDVCKPLGWFGEEVCISGDMFAYRHDQNTKFITYLLLSIDFLKYKEKYAQGAKVTRVKADKILKYRIPLPPLEIQNEIVSILDKITELETELESELESELEARKKQYEHYRKELLVGKDKVSWSTLGDISLHVSSGGTPLANKPEYYSNGTIPWLRTQEVKFVDICKTEILITEKAVKESSAKWIPENCVIIAISGATAGRSAINKIPLTTNQHCCNFQINPEKANYRYVFHWVCLQYKEIKSMGQGARSDLNASLIKSIKIPIPPLPEQERIVSILDKFDALVNDISIGLPAEIKARKQQYEYYRNKLLTFKEYDPKQ